MSGTALVADDVLVGTSRGPGLWLAPKGTAMPADTIVAIGTGFETVGFISDDMVTLASDMSQEDLFVWQAITPIRSLVTERSFTLEFTVVETSPNVLAVYFDAPKPAAGEDWTTGWEVAVPALPVQNQYAAIVDIQDGDKALRMCFDVVTLSEAGEVEVTRSGLLGWPITLKSLAGFKVLGGPSSSTP